MVTATTGIAIGEVVVFIPLTIASLIVTVRHGFVKQFGWVYLLTFTVISTIGAILLLLSVHNPDNTKYQTWGTALSGAGLSPMSMAPLGLLSWVFNIGSDTQRYAKLIKFAHIPFLLAIIGITIGANKLGSTDEDTRSTGHTILKLAAIMLVVGLCILFGFIFLSFTIRARIPQIKRRLVWAIIATSPFIGIRIMYTVIAQFSTSKAFKPPGPAGGNPWIHLLLATLTPVIATCILLWAGLTIPKASTYEKVAREHEDYEQQMPLHGLNPNRQGKLDHGYEAYGSRTARL